MSRRCLKKAYLLIKFGQQAALSREMKGTGHLEIYPTVGLKKQGEHIRANFGQAPFIYDIDHLMQVSLAEKKGPSIYLLPETVTHHTRRPAK